MDPLFFPVLALVAIVGVRVIGFRVGWWRAILIAWLGLATAGLLLTPLIDRTPAPVRVALVTTVGLVAMVAWTAVFQLFSGSRTGPTLQPERNPVRAARNWFLRVRRATEIALLASSFGLSRYARLRAPRPHGAATGQALRALLERAGGVFVKLGQFLSTRPDLVSAEIATELRLLQQAAAPLPMTAVAEVLDEELEDHRDVFTSFTEEPTAAASIAQVHSAVLRDGRRVAVKVQRPSVAERVRRDLDILVRLAERLERRNRWAHELRLLATAQGFAESVLGELDFQNEARNLRLMTAAVRDHPLFVVPQPIADLARGRVLVMEWADGIPLSQAARALDGTERGDLARAVLRCFLDQILVVGTFHADPHPGNLLLRADGRVALIDCGAIGLLDRRQRSALLAVLLATAAQDAEELRVALRPITIASRTVDEVLLERALGGLLTRHLGSGKPPGGELIAALMDLMREFGLAFEPVIGGALRTLATLQSTLEDLAPGFDLVEEATSYGTTMVNPIWARTHGRSPREELEALLPAVLPRLVSLPRKLDRIVDAAGRNELEFGVRLFPSDRERRVVDQILSRLVVVAAPAAVGLIGGLLLLASDDRPTTDIDRVLQAVGSGCVGLALLVLLSALVKAIRGQRERL
jgi:ubiquinone biosynthesis protein